MDFLTEAELDGAKAYADAAVFRAGGQRGMDYIVAKQP